jgi:hypothetical protein
LSTRRSLVASSALVALSSTTMASCFSITRAMAKR